MSFKTTCNECDADYAVTITRGDTVQKVIRLISNNGDQFGDRDMVLLMVKDLAGNVIHEQHEIPQHDNQGSFILWQMTQEDTEAILGQYCWGLSIYQKYDLDTDGKPIDGDVVTAVVNKAPFIVNEVTAII